MTTLYPRSAISIFVEVLQADGGDYAVCVNAATLALIDAGIPIRDVCCAVSCGVAIKDNVAYSLLDLGKARNSEQVPIFIQRTRRKRQEYRRLWRLECRRREKWCFLKWNQDCIWIILGLINVLFRI